MSKQEEVMSRMPNKVKSQIAFLVMALGQCKWTLIREIIPWNCSKAFSDFLLLADGYQGLIL
jgi:hypothetical protein